MFAALLFASHPEIDRIKTGYVWLKTNGVTVETYQREQLPLIWGGFLGRVKRLEGDGLRVTRIAEPEIHPNENRVDVIYSIFAEDQNDGTVQTLSESHPMRHFSLPELDLLADLAGFERLAAEAFLTGEEPSEDTWGLCVVLRKR